MQGYTRFIVKWFGGAERAINRAWKCSNRGQCNKQKSIETPVT